MREWRGDNLAIGEKDELQEGNLNYLEPIPRIKKQVLQSTVQTQTRGSQLHIFKLSALCRGTLYNSSNPKYVEQLEG